MKTFSDTIDLWPTLGEYADDIGIKYNAANMQRYRDSIDPDYYPAIVRAAEKRGYRVTFEMLFEMRQRSILQRRRPALRASRS